VNEIRAQRISEAKSYRLWQIARKAAKSRAK
jgi:hypothetical protein